MKKRQGPGTDNERRRARKLVLHRETLRRLDDGLLAQAAGGMRPVTDNIHSCDGFRDCGRLSL